MDESIYQKTAPLLSQMPNNILPIELLFTQNVPEFTSFLKTQYFKNVIHTQNYTP